MTQPVDLEDVYTAVQFLDTQGIRIYESMQTLEEGFRETKSRGFQDKDCQKQVGIKVANETQYLMVLGQPGAGKSTFLKKMGQEALKGKRGEFQHKCIPVFIELKEFTTDDIDIKAGEIPELTDLDELQTFVGQKRNKIWIGTAVNHSSAGILAFSISERSERSAERREH